MTRRAGVAQTWGTTAAERARSYPCDAALPDHDAAWFRAVGVCAPATRLFPWLCQLRVAPYSYDWIDNGGRRSPRQLMPGLSELAVGQSFMRIFDLIAFEKDRHVTLRLRRPGVFPPLVVTYQVASQPDGGCRLVVKLVLRFRPGAWDRTLRLLLPWLDWIMMRRQLLNLKQLCEASR